MNIEARGVEGVEERVDELARMSTALSSRDGWSGDGGPGRPDVLLTDRGDEELAAEAFRPGVADYMPKDGLLQPALRRAVHNAVEKAQTAKGPEAGAHRTGS